MALISKLDACNRILIASGLSPVTSLDNEGSADSRIAEIMLDDAVLDIQLQGLATTSFIKTFTPDAVTGEILLQDYISIEPADTYMTDDDNNVRLITFSQRDGKLFNVDEQTHDFSRFDEIKLHVEVADPFEDLTVQVQRDVIATASLRYMLNQSGDPQVARLLAAEQDKYHQQARASDVGKRSATIFDASTPARGAIARNWFGGFNSRYPNR